MTVFGNDLTVGQTIEQTRGDTGSVHAMLVATHRCDTACVDSLTQTEAPCFQHITCSPPEYGEVFLLLATQHSSSVWSVVYSRNTSIPPIDSTHEFGVGDDLPVECWRSAEIWQRPLSDGV
jgi:hypothetical protein